MPSVRCQDRDVQSNSIKFSIVNAGHTEFFQFIEDAYIFFEIKQCYISGEKEVSASFAGNFMKKSVIGNGEVRDEILNLYIQTRNSKIKPNTRLRNWFNRSVVYYIADILERGELYALTLLQINEIVFRVRRLPLQQ